MAVNTHRAAPLRGPEGRGFGSGHDFSIILRTPSGPGGAGGTALVGESMQLMPIIEEDVGGGGGAVQHVGGGRQGPWQLTRRTENGRMQ